MAKKEISVKDFVAAVGFKLDCGYEYGWNCYGDNSCGIGWEGSDGSYSSDSAGIVYDSKTHIVYEAQVWDVKNGLIRRWIRPGFASKHHRESRALGLDPAVAIDKTKFVESSPAECMALLKKIVRRRSHVR